jgi:hypothetical protein
MFADEFAILADELAILGEYSESSTDVLADFLLSGTAQDMTEWLFPQQEAAMAAPDNAVNTEDRDFQNVVSSGVCSFEYPEPKRRKNEVTVIETAGHTSMIKCPQCSSVFKTVSNFNVHLRVHTDVKRFACLECPATFRHSSSMVSAP